MISFRTRWWPARRPGTGPDVVVYNGPNVGQFVDAKAIIDLTPFWSSFKDKDLFAPAVVHSIDGKVYGVQGYVNLLGLWYNKDILDKVGVQPPTTIDQLTAALQKVTKAGYKGITLTGKPNDQGEWQSIPGCPRTVGPTPARMPALQRRLSPWFPDGLPKATFPASS